MQGNGGGSSDAHILDMAKSQTNTRFSYFSSQGARPYDNMGIP
jgi:hypothetical protein